MISKIAIIYLQIVFVYLCTTFVADAQVSGYWKSEALQDSISFRCTDSTHPLKDLQGNFVTVVYLEHLQTKNARKFTLKDEVAWLLAQGYRVLELNYQEHPKAVSPQLNKDIMALNTALANNSFGSIRNCSAYQTYILFEGYRIERNIPYFKDDPSVYNYPDEYTEGDLLYMDVVYPVHPEHPVPVVLSFSYSNSYATYDKELQAITGDHQHMRLLLGYTLAGFNDSILEGLAGEEIAWAIADHPKYCPWGKGKPTGGKNDTYKAYATNPDTAQKVKSAIRTLRYKGTQLGLNGNIGIFGFSRGSTAGALAVGDKKIPVFENAGYHLQTSSAAQAAVLGPGVFDYTKIYDQQDDGDGVLEMRCPWAWGALETHAKEWELMGATHLIATQETAPVYFFYNEDDAPYYQYQVKAFQKKLQDVGVFTNQITNYGTGHAIPQDMASIQKLYAFFSTYLKTENK